MASATTQRRLGLTSDKGIKAPVAAATTANITLSGEQTIDGIAVLASNAAGVPDRVLVKNQTSSIDNGVYDVSTGSWTRSLDCNGSQDLVTGTSFYIVGGSQAGQFWAVSTTGSIVPGTSSISFVQSITDSSVNALKAALAGGTQPILAIGGTGANSNLVLRSTSGAGTTLPATTTDTIIFQRGNNGSQELGRFSPGGSYAVGDFTDGTTVNQHGGDDGTTTRVSVVRAKTAPLFIGYTDRDNSESGGATGRSVVSFEGYRLANVAGSRESGALRVITEGSSLTQLGARVSILTRRDGFDETDFVERWTVQNDGNVYHGGGSGGVGAANRNGYAYGSTVYTISGQTGRSVIEMTTEVADADATVLGEISGIANFNTDSKRVSLIQHVTAGSTATKRGGAIKFYIKTDNGSLTEMYRFSQWGILHAGPTGALQAAPTLTISTNNITPTTPISFLGAGLVKNIVVPGNFATTGGQITIIPTAAFTTDATGNIALASTAVISKAITFTYDGVTTKWYPSY